MNVRIFWVCAMKCMCAQTRPRFILSSERVFGGMEFEPMLTPREKYPVPENFPRGGSNPQRCGQWAQTLPTSYSGPETGSEISPSKVDALWCILNNIAVGQTMLAVFFNGGDTEHTKSHIPLDPLPQDVHVKDAGWINKTLVHKLPALKAVGAKGIEQCHLFLLYQGAVLGIINYGLGLTILSQPNLLKLDRM